MRTTFWFLFFLFFNIPEGIAGEFLVGSGVFDITGPAAGQTLSGYGRFDQTVGGIHTRLRSRAFVIEDNNHSLRIAFVNADLLMVPDVVKNAVVARLDRFYPKIFTEDNLTISAVHTHSGPGGYSESKLMNFPSLGFDPENFEVIVAGITQSVVRAYSHLTPGSVFIHEGKLRGASKNRAPIAYELNPDASLYDSDVDESMVLLKFVTDAGRPIGMLNWFAVHNTSMSMANRLISSDNKGYAAYLFERLKGTHYASDQTFVAAFANANEGDVSPDIFSAQGAGVPDDIEKTRIIGSLQFEKARELYDNASERLHSSIDFRHLWVRFPDVHVGSERLCDGALGYSFVAGASDGPNEMQGYKQGLKQGDDFEPSLGIKIAQAFFQTTVLKSSPALERCHYPKPIWIGTGLMNPPWTPQSIPLQLLRIGSLAIVAVPAELTTMAGRRLKATVLEGLAPSGVNHVVIAGLSNSYSHYVTTKEEYASQQYEGASTLFGPNTLLGYQQIYADLARSMSENTPLYFSKGSSQPQFPPLPKTNLLLATSADGTAASEHLGMVLLQPPKRVARGTPVQAQFRAGNPRNNFLTQRSFLEVQKMNDGAWQTVADDSDFSTQFIWKKAFSLFCPECSTAVVEWSVPVDAELGLYRIVHHGYARDFWTGEHSRYKGITREFGIF